MNSPISNARRGPCFFEYPGETPLPCASQEQVTDCGAAHTGSRSPSRATQGNVTALTESVLLPQISLERLTQVLLTDSSSLGGTPSFSPSLCQKISFALLI